MNWLRLGADAGVPGANHSLATALEDKGDYQGAAQFYRKELAADPTFPGPSAFRLGQLILSGRVPGTPEEGAEFIAFAAAAGSTDGQRRLAELLMSGTGLDKNDETGRLWLRRAERAQSYALRSLVAALGGDPPLPPENSSARMSDIVIRANQGSLWGMVQLGSAFEVGTEVPQDVAKAEYWYRRAAAQGSPLAHYALGAMIINGTRAGTPEEAVALIERAARVFVPDAEAAYGLAMMTGRGLPKDQVEGAYWMTRAALHGSAWGKVLLAKAYLNGLGVPQDEDIGRRLLEEAGRSGYRQSK